MGWLILNSFNNPFSSCIRKTVNQLLDNQLLKQSTQQYGNLTVLANNPLNCFITVCICDILMLLSLWNFIMAYSVIVVELTSDW